MEKQPPVRAAFVTVTLLGPLHMGGALGLDYGFQCHSAQWLRVHTLKCPLFYDSIVFFFCISFIALHIFLKCMKMSYVINFILDIKGAL